MQNQISKEQYKVAEQLHADRVRGHLEQAANNPELAGATASTALATHGTLSFTAAGVTCDLTYTQSGRQIKFAGSSAPGVYFVSAGGGPFTAPESFVGSECSFELHGAVGPGLVNCTWWNDRGVIGTLVAVGGDAFVGVLAGSGVWSYA